MSNMMRHSTRRSLCLVDEFGKGTNAQDGISFLYACLRHFLDRGRECPRLLACTHYTELLELRMGQFCADETEAGHGSDRGRGETTKAKIGAARAHRAVAAA